MKKQLSQVKEFHNKFHIPVAGNPILLGARAADLRYRLMDEEVKEYLAGAKEVDLENIAKELADVLYTVYGTILEHGLQDKMEEIFTEVHKSNMSKTYHPEKARKRPDYVEADIKKFLP